MTFREIELPTARVESAASLSRGPSARNPRPCAGPRYGGDHERRHLVTEAGEFRPPLQREVTTRPRRRRRRDIQSSGQAALATSCCNVATWRRWCGSWMRRSGQRPGSTSRGLWNGCSHYFTRAPPGGSALYARACPAPTQAEAWWCTTWWHRANGVIRAHLGIDPLPVIDDDRRSVGLEWKVRTAAPLITEAASNGRHVSGSRTSTAHFPSSTGRLPLSTLLLRVSLDGPTDRTREDLTPVCRRPPPRGPR